MADERTPPGGYDDRTVVSIRPGIPLARALGPREAFFAARDRLADLAEASGTGEAGLAVAAVSDRARIIDAALVPDRGGLVIGRHGECGLRLPQESISLRHLAMLSRRDRGQDATHVWDLSTEVPFTTEDGTRSSALVADGPVYLSIGDYALWSFPVGVLRGLPVKARDAWEALPLRRVIDHRAPTAAPAPRRLFAAERRRSADGEICSHVTVVPPPLLLDDQALHEVAWGVLRLTCRDQHVRHLVSAERLEQGLLLGRYERCGISIQASEKLSRVHLLLVRIADEVWAIDTASTNGTSSGGQAISAKVLADRDELLLGSVLTLTWTREAPPMA